jgi:hypothetical protein
MGIVSSKVGGCDMGCVDGFSSCVFFELTLYGFEIVL